MSILTQIGQALLYVLAGLAIACGLVVVLVLSVLVVLAPLALALLPFGLLAMIARYMGWL